MTTLAQLTNDYNSAAYLGDEATPAMVAPAVAYLTAHGISLETELNDIPDTMWNAAIARAIETVEHA